MVGGVPSPLIVTLNVQVVLLVQPSVAVQITGVVPLGNKLPEGGVHVTVTLPELSDAPGADHDTGTGFVPQIVRTMFAGHWIEGGVVSRVTITEKVQVSRSPQGLVAVQLTVDVPRAKKLPAGGTQDTCAAKRQLFETAGSG